MKPRVLYVTHRVPWPPDRGDRIRTWNILKFLSRRADVDLACLADEPVDESTRTALAAESARLAIIDHRNPRRWFRGAWSLLSGRTITEGMFRAPELNRVLRQWSRCTAWDGALASSSGVAEFISRSVVSNATRRWVDLIDVDSQKWLDYAAASSFPKSTLFALEGRRLRQCECELTDWCDRLLVVSEAERQLFQTFCPTDRIVAAGNGVDTQCFAPDETVSQQPHSCVFVGVMDYRPNVDAVHWFADHVWPEIRHRFPDSVFRIVGRSPVESVRNLADRPGIEVTGSVPDVRPFLHQSACVVVPLQIARGIQNKLLEAMACGCAIVCSPEPLKAVSVEHRVQLLRAESPEEWVTSVDCLFRDDEERRQLGMAAAATVQLQHRWEACLEPLTELTGRSRPVAAIREEART